MFLSGCDNSMNVVPYELVLDETKTSGEVSRGGVVLIKVKGNSTTGYVWSVAEDGSPKLRFKKSQNEATNPNLIGSGENTTFVFEARRKGKAIVKLKYGRSWEFNGESKNIEFEIRVKSL